MARTKRALSLRSFWHLQNEAALSLTTFDRIKYPRFDIHFFNDSSTQIMRYDSNCHQSLAAILETSCAANISRVDAGNRRRRPYLSATSTIPFNSFHTGAALKNHRFGAGPRSRQLDIEMSWDLQIMRNRSQGCLQTRESSWLGH